MNLLPAVASLFLLVPPIHVSDFPPYAHQVSDGYFATEFLTSSGAVLCASPFNIKEAVAAMQDEKWMKSLSCLIVPADIPITKIEPDRSSLTEPWKVRVKLPSGGITLWGYAFSFKRLNGDKIRY